MIAPILLTVISLVLCVLFFIQLYFLISKLVKKQRPVRRDVVKTVIFGCAWVLVSIVNIILILFVAW